MSHTAVSLAPNGPGMFPFRHRGFDQDSPSWDIHQRAAILGYEITGRDDKDTPTSVGAWKEDTDTRGDLNCANYWQADYSQRPVGCWGFGYASVIQTTGTGNNVDTQVQGQNNPKVLPIGKNGNPDKRFKPKQPLILQPEGSGGGDPDSPNAGMNGDAGANGANGLPGSNGGGANDSGASVDLGGGWVYQDGAIAYLGPSPGQMDSLSGFNGGYFGGSGMGFNGIPANNFSSGFPTFSGVPSFFGSGGSIGVSYSWNR